MGETIEKRNAETILAYYQALYNADIPGMGAFLAEDLDYQVFTPGAYAGVYDREAFMDVLPEFFGKQAGPMKFDIKAITAQDDRVCIYAWGGMPLKDGGFYGNVYQYMFRLRDGKIYSVTEVCAPLPAGTTV